MSATNSGVMPGAGFTYVNQLLFYSRDHAKDDAGNTSTVTGENYVLMDMNTLAWVSKKEFPGGAVFSVAATLPFAKNDLTSDVEGNISGGGGFADSYYRPFILGWNRDRFSIRATYGFGAPTGRFAAGASDNVGSGYWTHTLSSGQTFYGEKHQPEILGRNGSYVVFRKLHQRVAEFRRYLKDSAPDSQAEELLAAKMMGRWRSGAPLALCPMHDDPAIGLDPRRNNDFLFKADDPIGYKTPTWLAWYGSIG